MKTFIYLDEAGQEMEESLRAQDSFFPTLTCGQVHKTGLTKKHIKSSEEHSSGHFTVVFAYFFFLIQSFFFLNLS